MTTPTRSQLPSPRSLHLVGTDSQRGAWLGVYWPWQGLFIRRYCWCKQPCEALRSPVTSYEANDITLHNLRIENWKFESLSEYESGRSSSSRLCYLLVMQVRDMFCDAGTEFRMTELDLYLCGRKKSRSLTLFYPTMHEWSFSTCTGTGTASRPGL